MQAERDQLRALQEQLVELGKEEDSVRMQRDLLAKQQEQLRTQIAEQKGRMQLLKSQVARRTDVDSELAVRKVELHESTEVARRARSTADSTFARAKQLRDERAQNVTRFRHDLDIQDAKVRSLQREVDALTELCKAIDVMQGRVENADALKAKLAAADNSVRAAERELEGLRARLEGAEDKREKEGSGEGSLAGKYSTQENWGGSSATSARNWYFIERFGWKGYWRSAATIGKHQV